MLLRRSSLSYATVSRDPIQNDAYVKLITFLYEVDEDKFYIKILELNEIYNFVVVFYFIWNHLGAQLFVRISQIYFKMIIL